MKGKNNSSGNVSTLVKSILLGSALSVTITVIGAALIAKLILSETVGENNMGYCVMILLFVASMAGCLTANAKIQQSKLKVTLLQSVGYYVGLLMIGTIFFGGANQALAETALVIAGGACIILLATNRAGQGRRAMHKAVKFR